MSAETWVIVSIAGFILFAVFLTIAIVLFIKDSIPSVINDLNGKSVERGIRKIQDSNKDNSSHVTEKTLEGGYKTELLDEGEYKTELLNKSDYKTEVLGDEYKTSVLGEMYETSVLVENEPEVEEYINDKHFTIVRSLCIVNTNEII